MKRHVLRLLLFFSGFALFAQAIPSYYIYIAPVGGVGKGPEDNAFFAGSLAAEVIANNHVITGRQSRSEFTIVPELGPMPGQAGQLFIFRIALTDSKTKNIITEQELIYSSLEEADNLLKVMASSAFSAITALHWEMDAWRNKWLYIGGSVFWAPRIYHGEDRSVQMVNFGGSILAEVQFLDFMSAEVGVTLVPDWFGILGMEGNEYQDWILEFPVLLKFPLKPATYYMIEPYGGIHINIPMYNISNLPLFSWKAGLQYGVKAEQGIIFIDGSFSMDIGKKPSTTRKTDGAEISFNRYMISLGLGYKFGFLTRYK